MNLEHAAKRYAQIRTIEIAVGQVEESIKTVTAHLSEVQEELSTLRTTKKTLLNDIRVAARDQGDCPLLPFMDLLTVAGEVPS